MSFFKRLEALTKEAIQERDEALTSLDECVHERDRALAAERTAGEIMFDCRDQLTKAVDDNRKLHNQAWVQNARFDTLRLQCAEDQKTIKELRQTNKIMKDERDWILEDLEKEEPIRKQLEREKQARAEDQKTIEELQLASDRLVGVVHARDQALRDLKMLREAIRNAGLGVQEVYSFKEKH